MFTATLPPTATKIKVTLDALPDGELLTSAELAAITGQTPVRRGDGGYGGQIARLASIYLPDYTEKVGNRRYWGNPESIQELKSKLGATSGN